MLAYYQNGTKERGLTDSNPVRVANIFPAIVMEGGCKRGIAAQVGKFIQNCPCGVNRARLNVSPLFALSRSTRSRDSRPMAGESSSGRPSGVARKGSVVCVRNSFRRRLDKISARFGKIRLRRKWIPLMSALPAAKGLRSLKAKAGFSSLVSPVTERIRERRIQNENFQCPPSTSSSKKDARRSR